MSIDVFPTAAFATTAIRLVPPSGVASARSGYLTAGNGSAAGSGPSSGALSACAAGVRRAGVPCLPRGSAAKAGGAAEATGGAKAASGAEAGGGARRRARGPGPLRSTIGGGRALRIDHVAACLRRLPRGRRVAIVGAAGLARGGVTAET